MFGNDHKIDMEKHRDYMPTAPALSAEVRETAQRQLQLIYDKNLIKDRIQLMLHLEELNNNLIGLSKHRNKNDNIVILPGELPIPHPVTAEMRIPCATSLESLRRMRETLRGDMALPRHQASAKPSPAVYQPSPEPWNRLDQRQNTPLSSSRREVRWTSGPPEYAADEDMVPYEEHKGPHGSHPDTSYARHRKPHGPSTRHRGVPTPAPLTLPQSHYESRRHHHSSASNSSSSSSSCSSGSDSSHSEDESLEEERQHAQHHRRIHEEQDQRSHHPRKHRVHEQREASRHHDSHQYRDREHESRQHEQRRRGGRTVPKEQGYERYDASPSSPRIPLGSPGPTRQPPAPATQPSSNPAPIPGPGPAPGPMGDTMSSTISSLSAFPSIPAATASSPRRTPSVAHAPSAAGTAAAALEAKVAAGGFSPFSMPSTLSHSLSASTSSASAGAPPPPSIHRAPTPSSTPAKPTSLTAPAQEEAVAPPEAAPSVAPFSPAGAPDAHLSSPETPPLLKLPAAVPPPLPHPATVSAVPTLEEAMRQHELARRSLERAMDIEARARARAQADAQVRDELVDLSSSWTDRQLGSLRHSPQRTAQAAQIHIHNHLAPVEPVPRAPAATIAASSAADRLYEPGSYIYNAYDHYDVPPRRVVAASDMLRDSFGDSVDLSGLGLQRIRELTRPY